jgi:hypothetical protein
MKAGRFQEYLRILEQKCLLACLKILVLGCLKIWPQHAKWKLEGSRNISAVSGASQEGLMQISSPQITTYLEK